MENAWRHISEMRQVSRRHPDGYLEILPRSGLLLGLLPYGDTYVTADGGTLCTACANLDVSAYARADHPDDEQWLVVGLAVCDVEPCYCDHCGECFNPGD